MIASVDQDFQRIPSAGAWPACFAVATGWGGVSKCGYILAALKTTPVDHQVNWSVTLMVEGEVVTDGWMEMDPSAPDSPCLAWDGQNERLDEEGVCAATLQVVQHSLQHFAGLPSAPYVRCTAAMKDIQNGAE